MIKVENISKSIGSKLLFKNISFDLPNNKIIGLLGANGAGKTSVFKAISGLSKIDSGKIKFYDENLHLMTLEERSNAGLNYVPQENSLFDDLSLKENLEAIVELRFKEISSDKSKQIENLLDLMKLTDKANTKSKFLSNGIDSTVHKKYFAFIGIIFSSPVIKATFDVSTFLVILS